MPSIDVVVDNDWHHIKGKLKGKSMNMQHSLPTTHDITWQGSSGTRTEP